MKARARRSAIGVAFLMVGIAVIWSPVAYSAFPGANGKIAVEASGDIWLMNPDGSGRVNLTATDASDELRPHWSPDGQQLLFTRDSQAWRTNPQGTVQTPLPILNAEDANWSPDGQKVVFARFASQCEGLYAANLDGTGETTVLSPSTGPCYKENPAWSPAGGMIAFDGDIPPVSGFPRTGIFTVNLDGSNLLGPLDEGLDPDWSPAGHRVLYTASITYPELFKRHDELYTMQPDGSAKLRLFALPPSGDAELGAWSPDGTQVVFNDANEPSGTLTIDDGGGNLVRLSTSAEYQPDWQPMPPLPPPGPGYPRPKGASPLSVSLVPAYRACTSPNRTHGAPLSFGSCAPPQQTSDALTVGTPDANGEPADSTGRVTFRSVPDNQATPADEADLRVEATLSDVRCRLALSGGYCSGGALSDYRGSLQLAPVIRITDRRSGGTARDPATGVDVISFFVPVPCAETPSSPDGSTCETHTTLNSLTPGTIAGGKRSIWELSQITLRDGGIDEPQVDAFTTFAVQGLFVP